MAEKHLSAFYVVMVGGSIHLKGLYRKKIELAYERTFFARDYLFNRPISFVSTMCATVDCSSGQKMSSENKLQYHILLPCTL